MKMRIIKVGLSCCMAGFFGGGLSWGAEPTDTVDSLKQELKEAKTRINQLEEDLFVATDGAGLAEETAEELPEGVYPWTQYVRRRPMGILFPLTATIPQGHVFGRLSHISQSQLFASSSKGDWWDDMLGIEDGVKVGIMVGYGLTENWDVSFQRSNGRGYFGKDFESHSYDLWDVMTKVKLLDEQKRFVDLSVTGGITYFWQDDNHGEWAGNAALILEKSIKRFRIGSGLLYTSLSDYQATSTTQSDAASSKLYLQEFNPSQPIPENHTVAVPLSISLALSKNLQLFGEVAFPVSGYETGNGPSLVAGCRIDAHTHSYSLFLGNTSNNGFNSTFSGGYKRERLDVFGFDISIFF